MYQFYVLWYKYYKCCSLYTAQKMKFSIKDFFSKCAQIRKKLRVWSHLLRKSLMENFIFCAVLGELWYGITVQKMKFSIKDFFNKCDQIRRHLLKKSLMENFIFCTETVCSVYSKEKKRKRVTNFSSFFLKWKKKIKTFNI